MVTFTKKDFPWNAYELPIFSATKRAYGGSICLKGNTHFTILINMDFCDTVAAPHNPANHQIHIRHTYKDKMKNISIVTCKCEQIHKMKDLNIVTCKCEIKDGRRREAPGKPIRYSKVVQLPYK